MDKLNKPESLKLENKKATNEPKRSYETISYSRTPDAKNAVEYYIVTNGKHFLIVNVDKLFTEKNVRDCVHPIRQSLAKRFIRGGKCKLYSIPYTTNNILDVRIVSEEGKVANFDELLFTNQRNSEGELTLVYCEPTIRNREMEIDTEMGR